MEHLTHIRFSPEKLKEARGRQSMSSVARALGISRQRLYAYENGKDNPPPDVLLRLFVYFDKPPEWFCKNSEKILVSL